MGEEAGCKGKLFDGSPCPREVVAGTEYCIFHLPDKEGELVERFEREFLEEVERQEEEHPERFDFTGFQFPSRILFSRDLPEIQCNDIIFSEVLHFGRYDDYSEGIHFLSKPIGNYADKPINFEGDARFKGATFEGYAGFYGATFERYAEFNDATFERAGFDGATFKGDAWFTLATFEGDAGFTRTTFKGYAEFSDATFEGDAGFTHATFKGYAGFTRTTFKGDARFTHATFKGDTEFYRATFKGYAGFSGATFKGTGFSGATFKGDAGFTRATFKGDAGFSGATFKGTEFTDATFEEDTEFIYATFEEDAGFTRTTFEGDARLWNAIFKGDARLWNAIFKGNAEFNGATFKGDARLWNAIFKGNAEFNGATFEGTAEFNGATFKGNAWFNVLIFKSIADFSEASFHYVAFSQATFNEKAIFTLIKIENLANFNFSTFEQQVTITLREENPGEPYILFLQSSFEKPGQVIISGFQPSKSSYLHTDISNSLIIPKKTDEPILDEKLLNKEKITNDQTISDALNQLDPYLNQQTVLLEYKLIRKSLENGRRYNEATPIFLREMKLARQNLTWKENFFECLSHLIFKSVSSYGESIGQPILIAIFFIIPFAASLLFFGQNSSESQIPLFLGYLAEITSVFFQLKSRKDLTLLKELPVGYELGIKLLSLLLLGNLYIALRRRLERK